MVRSTRMGLSAGIDPEGRIRGWLSANESEDRVLLVTVPSESTRTVYSVIGDALVYIALAYLAFLIFSIIRRQPENV